MISAEGVYKRRRKYKEETFTRFKCNEFLDYMMQASPEDAQWWISFFAKQKDAKWQWIEYGEYLEYWSNYGTHQVSRLKGAEKTPYRFESGAWLKKSEESLYQNASREFWICVFQRLTSVNDIMACSRVSRRFYQVCRMDIVYQRWIDRFFQPLKRCLNPFDTLPLWKQFLCLSGKYYHEWPNWMITRSKCAFLVTMMYHGHEVESPIYDVTNWVIIDGSTGRPFISRRRDGVTIFTHAYKFDCAISYSPTYMEVDMDRAMSNNSLK